MNAEMVSNSEDLSLFINCRVCDSMIDVTNKKNQHVVKCEVCNEATARKDPPPGQKYIRCACNCLLICKSTARRICCPRPTCKQVIILCPEPNVGPSETALVPGMCRVKCGHCDEIFLFSILVNQSARCPHCEKKSSVGNRYSRIRVFIFASLASFVLILAVITVLFTIGAVAKGTLGWIALYSFWLGLLVYFVSRTVYFFRMKKSIVLDNQS